MKFINRIFRVLCLMITIILLLIIVMFETVYNMAYEATPTAIAAMESSKYVTVEETRDYIVFKPVVDFYNTGIIFYPGAAVAPESYAPLMHAIAEEGYLCVVAKMPLNFAFMEVNVADGIRNDYRNIADWYMAGHSLGGSMAAVYTEDNSEQIKGLILLASYSTEDLNDKRIDVLSIYGSLDGILNMGNYEEYKENLPADMTEVVITGANHANYGNYGEQNGDGIAKICTEDQQARTKEAICMFLSN